jgi:hypothetical protein
MAQLKQRHSTVRGTFDPELARDEEELPFFAFGHWLVDQMVDLPITVEPAVTAARRSSGVPAGEWVELYYEVQGEGVKPVGWFIRHLVGRDLIVHSERINATPDCGEPLLGHQVPEWAADALAASRRQFEVDYATARETIKWANEAAKTAAMARAERIFTYRRVRLQNLIEEQADWIREKEASGSDRDRRVLPARRGQLAKNRERLSTLALEYEIEVEQIQGRKPGASATVLAAGVVMGV